MTSFSSPLLLSILAMKHSILYVPNSQRRQAQIKSFAKLTLVLIIRIVHGEIFICFWLDNRCKVFVEKGDIKSKNGWRTGIIVMTDRVSQNCVYYIIIHSDIARPLPGSRRLRFIERPLCCFPFSAGLSVSKARSALMYVTTRGLLWVNPANANAFRMFNISTPWTLSLRRGSLVASAGAPFAGANGCRDISVSACNSGTFAAHLGWNIWVEVTCIFRVLQLWLERSRISVNIFPVYAAEPRVRLVVSS